MGGSGAEVEGDPEDLGGVERWVVDERADFLVGVVVACGCWGGMEALLLVEVEVFLVGLLSE